MDYQAQAIEDLKEFSGADAGALKQISEDSHQNHCIVKFALDQCAAALQAQEQIGTLQNRVLKLQSALRLVATLAHNSRGAEIPSLIFVARYCQIALRHDKEAARD